MKHKRLIICGLLLLSGGCSPPGAREGIRTDVIGPEKEGSKQIAHTENPVWAVLDLDEDGELSQKEIREASESLKALDQNQDDVLTYPELLKNKRFLQEELQVPAD